MTTRRVSVAPDGTITVRVGKVELGQGIVTALAQIAADELDVELRDIRMPPANTPDGPDEGTTAGSMSVAHSGAALRQDCAEIRALFLAEAARRIGEEPARVVVRNGFFSSEDGARRTSYGALAGAVHLIEGTTIAATPKDAAHLRIVGTDVPRLDLPDKVRGLPRFIHDLALDGQLYGRVVRPPSPGACLAELDTTSGRQCAGVVAVVVDGSFIGVVAQDEAAADRAAVVLRDAARWKEEDSLPDEDDVPAYLRSVPSETFAVLDVPLSGTNSRPVAQTLAAGYSRP